MESPGLKGNPLERCGKDCGGNSGLTPIQKFFADTSVFLTGGTGFLGLLILEKLLASCPDISKIFLLIRSKKGKDPNSRLDELIKDVVFSRLKAQYPNFREKIAVVEGDCELPQLGLSSRDREILSKEVQIVFHAAATVRFDEGLKKATFINVRALRDVLALAHQMPNLKSFVHVSTAFSNCVKTVIREEVYPPPMDYRKLICVVEALPGEVIERITPMLLGDYPNTYVFTKQIGESLVGQEGKGLPIGINRPAIVISTYREPVRGWINNVYGATGLIAGGGVGLIRCTEIDTNCKANLVPADMVINSIIAVAWDIAENFEKKEERTADVPVYNFEADQGPGITWGNYINTSILHGHKFAPSKGIWYMCSVSYTSHLCFLIVNFFLHKIPALVIDATMICLKKPPMMLKVYKKIDKLSSVLKYFTTREWRYQSENIPRVVSKMTEEDRQIFPCDLRDMDWVDYLEHYVKGIRLYLLKDPMETLPKALKRYRRLYWLHQFTKTATVTLILWILWSILSFFFVLYL